MATTETTRTFSNMLNDYLPNGLLREELVKRDYVLKNINKDDGWVGASNSSGNGGNLIVPFKAAYASSVLFGNLTDSTDIAEDSTIRGQISTQRELWGSMIFNQRDLMEHNKISEKNFLKILPQSVDDFMDNFRNAVSVSLLNGPWFARLATGTVGTAGGLITVDRPDRFTLNQKLFLKDDDSSLSSAGYVSAINMNTKVITVVTARGGAVALDLSAYSASQNAKVYHPGSSTLGFSSMRMTFLSNANGGDATIYGVTKATYPYTQAINVDGSDITAVNIMEKIFDALTTIRQFGKGSPTDVLMSWKNLGSCMKVIESSKGAFNVVPNSEKAEQFNWMEVQVGSVTKGGLKLVGINECDDDIIFFVDWRALTFYSNGFIKKNVTPDGLEYFTLRNASGYQYILDICLFGEIVLERPSYCGILFGISY